MEVHPPWLGRKSVYRPSTKDSIADSLVKYCSGVTCDKGSLSSQLLHPDRIIAAGMQNMNDFFIF